MGATYRIARKGDYTSVKRTIKFLASCKDPVIQRLLLLRASDSVYKSICNAFLNIAQNQDLQLPSKQKKQLKKYHQLIHKIVSPKLPIIHKRRLIQQGGGIFLAAVLPAVLSTALSFLGSTFLSQFPQEKRQELP